VPTSVVREKRGALLETVGLARRAKDNVKQYSKGMLQRLGLAQALLHDPEMLVLDEPTDGLDPKARAEMRQIIRDLQDRGVTIFLNSHLLQEVEMICQRVAVLDKGQLRYCGPVSSIGEFIQAGNTTGSAKSSAEKVEFELLGDLEKIQQCKPTSVVIPISDQATIDKLVDALRTAGISIVALQPRRVSLEDAFLSLVDASSFKN